MSTGFARLTRRGIANAALVLCAMAANAQAAPLEDMLAFDGIYIPALAATNGAADAAGQARARATMQRLVDQWPALRARLSAVGRASRDPQAWNRALSEVNGQVTRAAAETREGRWNDAHETLEGVRMAMLRARESGGPAYYVDRLVAYHHPMEAVAKFGAATAPLTSAQREALVQAYTHARALWAAVEREPVDPARYGLVDARRAQYERGMADESAALTRLSDALRSGDDAAIVKAAAAIRQPFARAYIAFGLPIDPAPSR